MVIRALIAIPHRKTAGPFVLLFLVWSLSGQPVDYPAIDSIWQYGRDLASDQAYDEAVEQFERSSRGYEEQGAWFNYFRSEIDLSYALLDGSRFEEASQRIESALSRINTLPIEGELKKSKINILLAKGNIYFDQKKHAEAVDQFIMVRDLCRADTGKFYTRVLSFAHNNLGNSYNHLRQFNRALEELESAYSIKKELLGESHQNTLNTLRNIGDTYFNLGLHDRAIRYHLQVLEIEQADGETVGVADCYHELSKIYQHKRDFIKSREYALKALELYTHVYGPKHDRVAKMYHQIGNAYETEKKHAESIDWYQKAIDMRLELFGGHVYNSALSMMNIAKAYNWMGDSKRAIKEYEATWEVFDQLLPADHVRYTELWLSMGSAYLDMGDRKNAHRLFAMAYDLGYKRAAEKSFDRAMVCLYLQSTTTDIDDALMLCQQGLWEQSQGWSYTGAYELPAIEQMPNPYWSLKLLDAKGDRWVQRFEATAEPSDLDEALKTYKLATRLIDQSRDTYFNEGAKTAIANEGREIYEKAIRVSYLLETIKTDYLADSDVFYYMEKSRSLVLLEAINDQDFGLQYVPDSVNLKRRNTKTEIQELELQIEHQSLVEEELAALNARVFELKQNLSGIDRWIQERYPQLSDLQMGAREVDLAEVQKHLKPGELFIEFLVEADHIYALTADQMSTRLHRLDRSVLPLVRDIISTVKDQSNAESRGRDQALYEHYVSLSYQVYEGLLRPLDIDAYETLITVPDGVLSFLPFELLIKEHPGSGDGDYANLRYVLVDHQVSYAFSANLFIYKKEKYDYREDRILAFAPDYKGSSNEILASRSGFSALQHIRDEAARVVDLIGGKLYASEQASESNFKALAPNYRFLHLAMHAFTDEDSPMQSGLIFTDNPADSEDNVLHTYELYNMRLPAEMVVLSACNTGSGRLEKGEGVMSLARGFRQAGVPNIVMSLWQADDASTRLIMEDFYRLLRKGSPKDEALRQAKLAYLSESPKTFPYFWGAFVLMGDNDPLQMAPWYAGKWSWMGAIAILALGLGWFLFTKRF